VLTPDHALRYQTSLPDCRAYVLKPTCCPNMPSRRIVRDIRVKRPEFITLLGGAAARVTGNPARALKRVQLASVGLLGLGSTGAGRSARRPLCKRI
jgi:hypothetical protein